MPRNAHARVHRRDIAAEHYHAGVRIVAQHPMFAPLSRHAAFVRREGNLCPSNGWAIVTSDGYIHAHPSRVCLPEEWAFALAHCLLHLGFGHFGQRASREWNTACDVAIAKFLADMKFGHPPPEMQHRIERDVRSEERLAEEFRIHGIPAEAEGFGTAGPHPNMIWRPTARIASGRAPDWSHYFATGLAAAVTSAVNVAGGREAYVGATRGEMSAAHLARAWFISSYPLLGALAAAFQLIEDPTLCARMGISASPQWTR